LKEERAHHCRVSGILEQPSGADSQNAGAFYQQLTGSVDMINIANGCVKRTYKSDLWRNRGVNHHYFLMCPQGKS